MPSWRMKVLVAPESAPPNFAETASNAADGVMSEPFRALPSNTSANVPSEDARRNSSVAETSNFLEVNLPFLPSVSSTVAEIFEVFLLDALPVLTVAVPTKPPSASKSASCTVFAFLKNSGTGLTTGSGATGSGAAPPVASILSTEFMNLAWSVLPVEDGMELLRPTNAVLTTEPSAFFQ